MIIYALGFTDTELQATANIAKKENIPISMMCRRR